MSNDPKTQFCEGLRKAFEYAGTCNETNIDLDKIAALIGAEKPEHQNFLAISSHAAYAAIMCKKANFEENKMMFENLKGIKHVFPNFIWWLMQHLDSAHFNFTGKHISETENQ